MNASTNPLASKELLQAVAYFENLSLSDTQRMHEIYTEHAYFKDPFNEVNGVEPIRQIFAHMFAKVDEPRFLVKTRLQQGDEVFLTWDFTLRFKGETQDRLMHGSSHLRFAADGRIAYHRDYWDTAEELYEKLPLVGSIMRFLKRQATR